MALKNFAARGLKKVGRGVSKAGSAAAYAGGSPKALVGIGAVAFAAGVANEAGPAARDAAFESTLGTADADRYFTGRKFSARFLAGTAMGGLPGGALQATAPSDMLATGAGAITGNPLGYAAGGSAIGGLAGGLAGSKLGGGVKGKVLGAIGGAVVGGAAGGSLPYAGAATYVRSNREFFSQSPYGRSTANNDMSAVGDIVLGMHNSRRGY